MPTETLIRYVKDWQGSLMGDKTWSVLFDNFKVESVARAVRSLAGSRRILSDSIVHAKERLKVPAPDESEEDRLIDRIIAAQNALRP